jgi:hypothetical protein
LKEDRKRKNDAKNDVQNRGETCSPQKKKTKKI